jgi:hypothetical protein
MNNTSSRLLGAPAFILIMIFNSGVFSGKVHNPVSIPYSSEVFSFFLIIFSVYYFYYCIVNSKRVVVEDCLAFLLPLIMWITSAALSSLHFGQPLLYGLIEERRVFNFYVYFPIVYFIRRDLVEFRMFSKLIFKLVIISSSILLYMYLSSRSQFGGEIALREDRMSFGSSFSVVAIFLVSAVLICKDDFNEYFGVGRVPVILITAFVIFTLIFIVQNRQILIGLSVVLLAMVARKNKKLLLLSLSASIPVVFTTDFSHLGNLFSELTSDQYLLQSARSKTLGIIYADLIGNNFVGMGSLSNLWQDGFSRIYNDYFFLSDVGVFGTLYRYGFIAPFFVGILIFYEYKNIDRLKFSTELIFLKMLFWYMIVLLPLGSLIENRGNISGIVLGLAVALSRYSEGSHKSPIRHNRSDSYV